MPVYSVTDPSTGTKLSLTGDSPPTENELNQIFAANGGAPSPKAAPQAPTPNTYVDMLKSAGAGLAKGAAAVVGLPGDVSGMLDAGANKIRQWIDPSAQPISTAATINKIGGVPALPTSQQVNSGIQSVTGQYHAPQTTGGKYAETIASFAPAAVAPGGVIARAARVIIPGAASEAAGQATEGTDLEPYARTIGALAGGAAAGIGESAITANRPTPGVPTTSELKQAATREYTNADNAGLVVKKDSVQNMASGMGQSLADAGMDATLHPKATAVFKNISNVDDNVTLKGMDILRRQASAAAGSADKDERRIGRMIIDHIDDYIGNLQPQDVVQGDAPGAAESITNARSLWSRASKGEIIDNAIAKAKTNSGLYTVAGDENALRTQFRKLANNDRAMRRFSPDEQAAITQVATGTSGGNAMRYLGKLAPRGVISYAPTYEAFEHGGPVAALGVAAAGELGKIGAWASTTRNARLASELVRQGPGRSISQAGLGKMPQNPTAATLSGLAAQPVVQNTPQK